MSASTSQKARIEELRRICQRNNVRIPMRHTKLLLKDLGAQPLDDASVMKSFQENFVKEQSGKDILNELQQKTRARLRMDGDSWLTKVQLDIAKTAVHAWIRIDEIRPDDRDLIGNTNSCRTSLGNLAQRLHAARKYTVEPMRQTCASLDIDSFTKAGDEDLVHVRAAMRRLNVEETDPSTVMAVIERAFRNALKCSKALTALEVDPYNLERFGALPSDNQKRRVIALIGPTNSGKTHMGMEMLRTARTGSYLGPLRLMAMEQYDKLSAQGISIDMRTGEETIVHDGSTHVSSTIEMADVEKHHEVVLIDEIQMLSDPARGWAWTRAVFHSHCDTLLLAGSQDSLPYIRKILETTGEELEIHHYERRTPLDLVPDRIRLSELRPHDAVIAFSRTNVLALKAEIAAMTNPLTGHLYTVATIYGALSPEVRRSEAARFSSGEADILVATDAVGMGLNLPIDRVVFSSLTKYDGTCVRELLPSEIRQIGGRAGRTGQNTGLVAVLNTAGGDMEHVSKSLSSLPEDAKDARPFILPDYSQAMTCIEHMAMNHLSKALPAASAILRKSVGFRSHIDPDTLDIIESAEQSGLGHAEAFEWMGCPINIRDKHTRDLIETWMSRMASGLQNPAPKIPRQTKGQIDENRLKKIEDRVTQACAYLWLSHRWPSIFSEREIAIETRRKGNLLIEAALKQKVIRMAPKPGKKIPA